MKQLFLLLILSLVLNGHKPGNLQPIYSHYRFSKELAHGRAGYDLMGGGKDSPIFAPITGEVIYQYYQHNGNPLLIIENDSYRVKLLHGYWNTAEGDRVNQGEIIGYEGNMGLTFRDGQFCGTGSNCGYHTHIEVWDKINNSPVNLAQLWD